MRKHAGSADTVPPDHQPATGAFFVLLRNLEHGRDTALTYRQEAAAVRDDRVAVRYQVPLDDVLGEHGGRAVSSRTTARLRHRGRVLPICLRCPIAPSATPSLVASPALRASP